jgi:DNA-binding NarL/FixJ family response regulator
VATEEASSWAPLHQSFSPLPFQLRRGSGAIVGRPTELEAIKQELGSAAGGRLAALTLEGEPGIGKTRLILAATEAASAQGFTVIPVAADEEIRGPFLLARTIVGSPEAAAAAASTEANEPLERALAALSGRDDPGLSSLPPDQKLLRTLDLGAVALRALAEEKPLALFVDDLQWADDDSVRVLRYLVRVAGSSPIFLMMATRPEELAFVNEAVNLIADMERLGMVRRLKLDRLSQVESGELLRQALGGTVDASSAATMHAQAEGVPFIVEELAHAYRDAGMVQEIDGTWALAKNAERLIPSAVRTLISRRAARVPEDTKKALAEAGVLGRHFSLKDLTALRTQIGDQEVAAEVLDEALQPAVAAGLLVAHGQESAADYSFAHDQVREFAVGELTPARRRAIHTAIVELLLAGEPAPASLPLLAYHAKAAGDMAVCVRFSLQAIANALGASAPEEVMRVVDLALPAASTPQDRVALLRARDQALDMLRRAGDRLQGLAELAALAEALGDGELETEVQLRRAAAMRLSDEWEQAVDLARRVRDLASSRGDRPSELTASLEIGQALLHASIGEAYSLSTQDTDLDGAGEAFRRAVELAEELGDDASLAAAHRELGIIAFARVRDYFVERVLAGEQVQMQQRIAAGATPTELMLETPVAPFGMEAAQHFATSLELYERVGDRRGAMTTIIAMAYASWGPDIHFGSGAGRHIEEIRRVFSRMESMTNESERSMAEAQMLYGVHVFSRAKVLPDLAILRGADAYRQARLIGDRALEFVAAGGTAMAYLDLGDGAEGRQWIDKAAAVAAESPTPFRARQLEIWRGSCAAVAGNAEPMRKHLERAVQLATEQGRPAARCEALALLAMEAARLGARDGDADLLAVAERAAGEVKTALESVPGHPPWGAQADAALTRVALASGDMDRALASARSAMAALEAGLHEDAHLEILLPVAEALIQGGSEEEAQGMRGFLQVTLAMIAQRTSDESIRARWLRGPVGAKVVELAGPLEGLSLSPGGKSSGPPLDEMDVELLRRLVEGLTNREIAERLQLDEEFVSKRFGEIFAGMGATSRAQAKTFALLEQVV